MLSTREKQVYDLVSSGMSYPEVSEKLKICVASVRTYWCKAKAKVKAKANQESKDSTVVYIKKQDSKKQVKKKVEKESGSRKSSSTKEPELRRCSSFNEFSQMMDQVQVSPFINAQTRLEMFKDAYCKVCIYPNRCDECPTKVLMNKYLF